MEPIYDPVRLRQPKLREFAFQAAWIATVAETVADLDNLLVDLPPDEPLLPDFTMPWPWDVDSMAVARSLVQASRDAAAQKLRHRLASWFGEDPEHGPLFRLAPADPYNDPHGLNGWNYVDDGIGCEGYSLKELPLLLIAWAAMTDPARPA